MSWKFGGIYFTKDYSSDIDGLFKDIGYDFSYTGNSLSFKEVVQPSFHESAVGIINGNTLLQNNFIPYDCAFEPGKWFELDDTLEKVSVQGDVLCFFLDGISSSYGFSYFREGVRIRCRGMFNGKLVLEDGKSLPQEVTDGQETEEEERIFRLMAAFTGVTFSQLILDNNFRLLAYRPVKKS